MSELVQCLFCEDYFPDHDEWYDHLQMLHEDEAEYADLIGEALEFFEEQFQIGLTVEEIADMVRKSTSNEAAADEIVALLYLYYTEIKDI